MRWWAHTSTMFSLFSLFLLFVSDPPAALGSPALANPTPTSLPTPVIIALPQRRLSSPTLVGLPPSGCPRASTLSLRPQEQLLGVIDASGSHLHGFHICAYRVHNCGASLHHHDLRTHQPPKQGTVTIWPGRFGRTWCQRSMRASVRPLWCWGPSIPQVVGVIHPP
jgi:hypothetical protein